jgi:NAD(P)-dependent dehydrogenase (short-subunit alcohol dehydrogenase family)
VAFVTGAGGERGFGRAIARRLAEDGADVVVTDLGRREVRVVPAKPLGAWRGLDDVVAEIEKLGRRALALTLDVRDPAQVGAAIARAVDAFGRLDILVNNAAAPPGPDRVPVVDLDPAAWAAVLETNLTGTYLCARAAATVMLRQKGGGRIINMSSEAGKTGSARMAAYCASKFGIIGFTQSLARELAPSGITVNAICPGAADTERIDYMGRRPDGSFDPELRAAGVARHAGTIPLGRLATAQDVAELAAFLASDRAAYVTGQAINLSGGLTSH